MSYAANVARRAPGLHPGEGLLAATKAMLADEALAEELRRLRAG